MRLASSVTGRKLDKTKIIPTAPDFKKGVENFVKLSQYLSGSKKIKAVIGGVAGPLNKRKTKIINAPNLKKWNHQPLKKILSAKLKTKIYLENDTDMAGLGEAVYGAGKDKDIVVYESIGTGVGGCRIVNKKIDKNFFGFEPGHQIFDAGRGLLLNYRYPPTLENYVSGKAIKRIYKKDPVQINDQRVWNEVAKFLAFGLNNTIVHWSPEVVVLGGSIMKKVSIIKVKRYLKNVLKIFPVLPIIRKAKLKDLSGLYGAMYYLEKLKNI